jgi:hypothetical protein
MGIWPRVCIYIFYICVHIFMYINIYIYIYIYIYIIGAQITVYYDMGLFVLIAKANVYI